MRRVAFRKRLKYYRKRRELAHIHLLAEIPTQMSVLYFMGYLKGESTLMIFERHASLKYKYGNRHFWCRGDSMLIQ